MVRACKFTPSLPLKEKPVIQTSIGLYHPQPPFSAGRHGEAYKMELVLWLELKTVRQPQEPPPLKSQ